MKLHVKSMRIKFAIIFIAVLSCSAILAYPVTIHWMNAGLFGDNIPAIVTFALIICFSWGSLLMSIAVGIITRPLKLLTKATKQVSKGYFDVRVDYKSQDEIGILIQNFNLMAQELQNMEYLRKDFLSNISHEFKTPISSIQGFSKLLREKKLDSTETQTYLKIIEEECGRLSNLASNILQLTNIENQAILPLPSKFYLDEQIRKTILLFTNQWEEKNLLLDIQLDKVEINANEELMQQVWTNLIENAIKFSPNNSTIGLYLRESNKAVHVIISDQGIGIPKEKQELIFDKFYQADTSHTTPGSGLGLSIVKSILDQTQGSICVESIEEQGTTFTVTLPKTMAQDN